MDDSKAKTRPIPMKGKRVHFFYVVKKKDSESQTQFDSFYRRSNKQIFDRCCSAIERFMVIDNNPPRIEIERMILNDFSQNIGFFLTQLNDYRFYSLTPVKNRFKDLCCELCFEFYMESYTLKNKITGKSLSFKYDPASDNIIKSLQSGLMSIQLLILIEHFKVKKWYNGNLVCDIIDYRFSPPEKKRILIKISNDTIVNIITKKTFSSNKNQTDKDGKEKKVPLSYEQRLEAESKIITVLHPTICTDPSPDVCRVKSLCDFRQKMWNDPNAFSKRVQVDHYSLQHQRPNDTETLHKIELHPLKERIIIPDTINNIITSNNLSIKFNSV